MIREELSMGFVGKGQKRQQTSEMTRAKRSQEENYSPRSALGARREKKKLFQYVLSRSGRHCELFHFRPLERWMTFSDKKLKTQNNSKQQTTNNLTNDPLSPSRF